MEKDNAYSNEDVRRRHEIALNVMRKLIIANMPMSVTLRRSDIPGMCPEVIKNVEIQGNDEFAKLSIHHDYVDDECVYYVAYVSESELDKIYIKDTDMMHIIEKSVDIAVAK